jgi:phosphoribosylformimino-5-aminoimidazole carboxamide ribotide isomerase
MPYFNTRIRGVRIYPVLDVLNGVIVRAVAGERGAYRPVVSQLTDEPAAESVAAAFRSTLGLDWLYLADLDAILHLRPNTDICRTLCASGFQLLVDAGVRSMDDIRSVLNSGARRAVVGLETCPGPDLLHVACKEFGADQLVFSLDLRKGRPLGDLIPWKTEDPLDISRQAIRAGIRRLIVLDLAGVGLGQGVPTVALCRQIRSEAPHVELITGGGVQQADELDVLAEVGIDGVLLASALHDGQVTREDVARFA